MSSPTPLLSMNADVARVSKPYLRVAFVGKLAEARVYTERFRDDPTITEPRDEQRYGFYVPFVLEEVRVLDSRTGQMVSHFTPEMRVGK
jgi:hypothetical protein